jgi:hypothetical protein
MKFPSIKSVAAELRKINKFVDDDCEVRLQVYDNDKCVEWAVRWGLPDYDQDHRGYWGYDYVPGNGRRFSSERLAKELIQQVKEQYSIISELDR